MEKMSKLAHHRRSAKSSSQTESMDNSDVTNGIPLPQSRRMGVPGSETWSALLDAAEKLMREKGYAAVTSRQLADRKSTRLNSSHVAISYAVFCLQEKMCSVVVQERT